MAPSPTVRIGLAQLDLAVGDIAGNERVIGDAISDARARGVQLVVFPELAITGYPAEDLWIKEHFLSEARAAVERLAGAATGICALVGFPERAEDVFNACAVLADGRVAGVYRKCLLPNYGVFDEHRYFQAGSEPALLDLAGTPVGLTICEDMWEPGPPASDEALAGATLICNPSASPYHRGKGVARERMMAQRARDYAATVAFCNHVGGQDELVFDGHSFVVDHTGEVIARAPQFEPALLVCDIDLAAAASVRLRDPGHRPGARARPSAARVAAEVRDAGTAPPPGHGGEVAEVLDDAAEVYGALVLGLRDYVEKNGFGTVVLGLSGGIDSALVACVAHDALGPDRVRAVIMPSPYSSAATQQDARDLAAHLGLETLELPIASTMEAYGAVLAEPFAGRAPDITEENLQARIRGNLLMALSNKFGWLVVTTGNKSENSVGYSTLYGDSAGGFAVIKDVPKTLVYALARHRNATGSPTGPIPATIIERAPSAELAHDQRDEDSLPPYEVLDRLIEAYVEEDLGREALIGRGEDPAVVDRVIGLIDRAEYKRRQAPPGIKITTKAFGRDRRMPITNRYRG